MEKIKSFYVIRFDINRRIFYKYDIIPILLYEYLKKKQKNFDLKNFVDSISFYHWHFKAEHEIIITDWPNSQLYEKIDIYHQIKMNFETILDILEFNINHFTEKEIKTWLDSSESNFESIKNIHYDNN